MVFLGYVQHREASMYMTYPGAHLSEAWEAAGLCSILCTIL